MYKLSVKDASNIEVGPDILYEYVYYNVGVREVADV
jgi:hypothetical protein